MASILLFHFFEKSFTVFLILSFLKGAWVKNLFESFSVP